MHEFLNRPFYLKLSLPDMNMASFFDYERTLCLLVSIDISVLPLYLMCFSSRQHSLPCFSICFDICSQSFIKSTDIEIDYEYS